MSVDTKRAKGLARRHFAATQARALLESLADEVDRLRELLRGLHRCDSLDDVSNAWGCPDCVRELRDEVKTKWEPLLAAAVFGHDVDCHSREPHRESGDCELCKRITACEEN